MYYFWRVILDLDTYIFPLETCIGLGGHLRLESSCIRVNTVVFLVSLTLQPLYSQKRTHISIE